MGDVRLRLGAKRWLTWTSSLVKDGSRLEPLVRRRAGRSPSAEPQGNPVSGPPPEAFSTLRLDGIMAPKSKKSARKSSPRTPSLWVASTAVVVGNREAARRWYNEVLGLPTAMQEGHWLTVGHPRKGGAIHLCQAAELDPPLPMEPGNTGILLLLDGDFQTQCDALKRRGVAFVEGPIQRPWGWDATIRDPDGNELLLMPSG